LLLNISSFWDLKDFLFFSIRFYLKSYNPLLKLWIWYFYYDVILDGNLESNYIANNHHCNNSIGIYLINYVFDYSFKILSFYLAVVLLRFSKDWFAKGISNSCKNMLHRIAFSFGRLSIKFDSLCKSISQEWENCSIK